jgi:hypothetical protein
MKIDLFVRAMHEPKKTKNKNKKGQQRYISRICGGGTPEGGELKLGTFVKLMDVINYTNFYLFLMNSFWASGGVKNEDLPLKGIWLLQHCLALPRWQLACDNTTVRNRILFLKFVNSSFGVKKTMIVFLHVKTRKRFESSRVFECRLTCHAKKTTLIRPMSRQFREQAVKGELSAFFQLAFIYSTVYSPQIV